MENEKPKFKFPTETVELPSKGWLYPSDHPLSSGTVEVKYMTAKEEDILTNQSYIKQGIAIEKLLQSVIVTKFNIDDLVLGDKNSLLIAARVLGYGKDYSFTYGDEEITVDMSNLPSKEFDISLTPKGVNEFPFTLPHSGTPITFKILTGHDEKAIENEIKGMKRIQKNFSADSSLRLKHMITSVDGDSEKQTIRDFVDNYLLARDTTALRSYYKEVSPDTKMTFIYDGENGEEEVAIPLEVQFLWPDARV